MFLLFLIIFIFGIEGRAQNNNDEKDPINLIRKAYPSSRIYDNKLYTDLIGSTNYYPYKDSGYWGMKCKGEIVIAAIYDSLIVSPRKYNVFGYKKNNKWGIMSFSGIIKEAQYDDLKLPEGSTNPWMTHPYIYYVVDNKWGIMTCDAQILDSAKYDYISSPIRVILGKYKPADIFFIQQNSISKLITSNGFVILDNITDSTYVDFFKNERRINYASIVSKEEKSYYRIENTIRKAIKSSYKKLSKKCPYDTIHFYDKLSSDAERDFDSKYGSFNDSIKKYPILIGGEKAYINELGIINITIDSSIEDCLRRDSTNVYALYCMVENNAPKLNPNDFEDYYDYVYERDYVTAKYDVENYSRLLELCKLKGLDKSPLYEQLSAKLALSEISLPKAIKALNIHIKAKRSAQKIDRISGIISGVLNGISSVVTPNSSLVHEYSVGVSNNNSHSNGENLKEQYKIWEKRAETNYNSLINLGIRVKRNGKDVGGTSGESINGGNYTIQKQKLREAQREMKNIRDKAKKRGITIPKSSYEDVIVKY